MILGAMQCKCNCSNIMLMHIHGNDASDKESLESCYCEIILHVFPGNHKVRACLRVRVSVSIWQGATLRAKSMLWIAFSFLVLGGRELASIEDFFS